MLAEYGALLAARGALDFDDLVIRAVEMLESAARPSRGRAQPPDLPRLDRQAPQGRPYAVPAVSEDAAGSSQGGAYPFLTSISQLP